MDISWSSDLVCVATHFAFLISTFLVPFDPLGLYSFIISKCKFATWQRQKETVICNYNYTNPSLSFSSCTCAYQWTYVSKSHTDAKQCTVRVVSLPHSFIWKSCKQKISCNFLLKILICSYTKNEFRTSLSWRVHRVSPCKTWLLRNTSYIYFF